MIRGQQEIKENKLAKVTKLMNLLIELVELKDKLTEEERELLLAYSKCIEAQRNFESRLKKFKQE